MWRTIAGIVVGLVAWVVIVTILNWGLRLWLPGYVQAEPLMSFTLGMIIARLSIVGLVLRALFVPDHIHVWNKFPIWYHLTSLITLAPLVALGARLASRAKARPAAIGVDTGH